LRPEDELDAARHMVAWVVEGGRLPGCGEVYPESGAMQAMANVIVACDLVPPGTRLSENDRVEGAMAVADLPDRMLDIARRPGACNTGCVLLNVYRHWPRRIEVFVGSSAASFGSAFLIVFRRTPLGLTADVRQPPQVIYSLHGLTSRD
jgi:hypothetical protein